MDLRLPLGALSLFAAATVASQLSQHVGARAMSLRFQGGRDAGLCHRQIVRVVRASRPLGVWSFRLCFECWEPPPVCPTWGEPFSHVDVRCSDARKSSKLDHQLFGHFERSLILAAHQAIDIHQGCFWKRRSLPPAVRHCFSPPTWSRSHGQSTWPGAMSRLRSESRSICQRDKAASPSQHARPARSDHRNVLVRHYRLGR
jgi:hypothetical protein